MDQDPEENKPFSSAGDNINRHYDDLLGTGTSGEGTKTENGHSYTGDSSRDQLAEDEREGDTTQSKQAAKEELQNFYSGSDGGKSEKRKANLASRFIGKGKSKTKKRVRVGLLGAFSALGLGSIVLLLFLGFMLISGFGVKQASIVVKNYGMYRINRIGHAAITRVIEGDVRVKSGEGLGSVTPSSALDRARGLDIEKVLKNLESDGTLGYVRDADGKITDIIFNGEEKISLDGLKRNPITRADTLNTLSDQLERHSPALAETSNLTGKVADGVLERVNVGRIRWSEKILAKIRKTKSPTEALGVEQESQIDTVRQNPKNPKTGDAAIDAAEEAAEKNLKPIATEGIPEPTVEVIPSQIEAIESSSRILSRNAVGNAVEGASAVIVYTLCTVNAVDNSYEPILRQNNDASVRTAGQLQSAGDQVSKGGEAVTAASVGAARKALGDFQDQANYQKAAYTPNWNKYRQLPELDQPQPSRDKGWAKTFHTISNAVNGAWDGARTATGGKFLELIPGTGNIPGTWDFTEFCQKINTPIGGLVFGVLSGIIEQAALNAIWPGGGGVSGAAGKEAISEGMIKQLINTVGEKGLSIAIKDALENALSGAAKSISDRFVQKIVSTLFKGGVITAATAGMTYLVIKLADGSGGHTYNGTSDQDYVNKAAAGTNVMQADLLRTRAYGVPTDPATDAAYLKKQYAEYVDGQAKKSLADRFLKLDNPYSVSAKIASSAPFDAPSAKTLALRTLNPLNALGGSQSGVAILASRLTDQKAVYAASRDEDKQNDGVKQWGYTLAEEELMKKDEYSLESISAWAGTQAGKDAIAEYDEQFGPCYSTENEMSDILLSDDLKEKCLEKLPTKNKTNPDLFKWRLYHFDILSVDQTKDIQEVTNGETPSTTPGSDPGSDNNNGEITSDSSSTPCATGTDDLGIRDDAYSGGERIKIRLCAVNSIAGNSEESNGTVPGANGRALVSSVASGAWQKLGEAAKAGGISLSAGSSWRTMAHQEELCRKDKENGGSGDCPNGNYNDVAQPGHSNHQAGTAIDISEIFNSVNGASSGRSCSNPQTSSNATYLWVAANARSFGIKNYANEAWHWGTSEKC